MDPSATAAGSLAVSVVALADLFNADSAVMVALIGLHEVRIPVLVVYNTGRESVRLAT